MSKYEGPQPPLWNWLDATVNLLGLIAGVLLSALTLLVCADVVSRTFDVFSMPWSIDVAQYSLYIITFLGSPWVLKKHGHISVDLLVQSLSARNKEKIRFICNIIGVTICSVILYYSCLMWLSSFSDNILVHQTFVFPEWWLLSFAPPTFLMLALIFLCWIVRDINTYKIKLRGQ